MRKYDNLDFDDFTYVIDDRASKIATFSFIIIGIMLTIMTYLGMFP